MKHVGNLGILDVGLIINFVVGKSFLNIVKYEISFNHSNTNFNRRFYQELSYRQFTDGK